MTSTKRTLESSTDDDTNPEIPAKRACIEENSDLNETHNKLVHIINREFQTEIYNKQEETKRIQSSLLKAKKKLHLLKYVAIKSFYDRHELSLQTKDETIGSNDYKKFLMPNQSRIHPAIKKIIGKKPILYELNRTRTQNKIQPEIKQEIVEKSNSSVPLYENNIEDFSKYTQRSTDLNEPIRNRQKTKYQIIVGNVSKWLPKAPGQPSDITHKWVVYVRGPRDDPEIGHFVKKVRFFLHPSYHPNDIVEVEESPFQLTRRGWGEFPLRIQIHFHCTDNKPVDIIHNLKLDCTFSGRQKLGKESLIQLYLYGNHKQEIKTEPNSSIYENSIKKELNIYSNDYQTDLNQFISDELITKTAPDPFNYISENKPSCSYINNKDQPSCSYTTNPPIYYNNTENTYNNHTTFNDYCNTSPNKTQNYPETTNSLTNGALETKFLSKNNFLNHKNNIDLRKGISLLKHNNNKKISKTTDTDEIVRDHNLVYLVDHWYTSRNRNLYMKHIDESIDRERYKIKNIRLDQFETTQKLVFYLFKQLPLYTKLANDLSYKCTYPYVAHSIEEFKSWNFIKRTCSEWFRAKQIKTLLITNNIPNHENWTTKILLMYGRAHAFTPNCSYEIFKHKTESAKTVPNRLESTKSISTCTEFIPISIYMENEKNHRKHYDDDDCVIDVESLVEEIPDVKIDNNTEQNKPIQIDDDLKYPLSYINKTVKSAGIDIQPEEVEKDLWLNTTEIVLLQSVKCLAEELIRKAFANNVINERGRNTDRPLDRNDIFKVLLERPEFQLFLNEDLGKVIEPQKPSS